MYDQNKFTFAILTAFVFLFTIATLAISASFSLSEENAMVNSFEVNFTSVEVVNSNVKVYDEPKINKNSTSLTNVNFVMDNPSDEITYKITVLNKGTLDAEIAQFTVTDPRCSNKDVCNDLEYVLHYDDNKSVDRGDVIEAQSGKTMYLTVRHVGDYFDGDVSVEGIQLSINYTER